jgi:hypothetical protein
MHLELHFRSLACSVSLPISLLIYVEFFTRFCRTHIHDTLVVVILSFLRERGHSHFIIQVSVRGHNIISLAIYVLNDKLLAY